MDNHGDNRSDYYPPIPGGGMNYARWRFPYSPLPQGWNYQVNPMSPVSPSRTCSSVSPSTVYGGINQHNVFQFQQGVDENPYCGR